MSEEGYVDYDRRLRRIEDALEGLQMQLARAGLHDHPDIVRLTPLDDLAYEVRQEREKNPPPR